MARAPTTEFLTSTKVPALAPSPNSAPGLNEAKGPTSASTPTDTSLSTEYHILAPEPIRLSLMKQSGPSSAPPATEVDPSRCTPGRIRTPASRRTEASI